MIFVIEDDRGWEEYYRRILRGREISVFHDGVEAVFAMNETVPDLVILDVLLSGPTGFAVLNEMRSYPELLSVPVILVSSVADATDLAESVQEYGVVAALDKGRMRPEELLALVEECCDE